MRARSLRVDAQRGTAGEPLAAPASSRPGDRCRRAARPTTRRRAYASRGGTSTSGARPSQANSAGAATVGRDARPGSVSASVGLGQVGRGLAFDLDRVPATFPNRRRPGSTGPRVRSTISSRCSREREHDTVARAAAAAPASTPASAGATRAISSVTSSTVARSKSAPSRSASSAAMRQSSIAVPSGATLRPTRCTRPFEVGDACPSSRPTACTAARRRRAASTSGRGTRRSR